MTEKIFVNKVLKHLNEIGYFWKTHGSIYSAGKADIIGLIDGDFVAVEVKVIQIPAKDNTVVPLLSKLVTKSQLQFINDVIKNKGLAYIFVGIDKSKGGMIFFPSGLRDMTKVEIQQVMIKNMFKTIEKIVKR